MNLNYLTERFQMDQIFKVAFQAIDESSLQKILHPEVVLHSPILESAFPGRGTVIHILLQARKFIDNFQCVDEILAQGRGSVRIAGSIEGHELDAMYYFQLTSENLIQEMWVYVRPMPAYQAFAKEMGKRLGISGSGK